LFNNGLEGKKWRTIDLYEGDKVNESSLKVLARAGVDFNRAKAKPAAKRKPRSDCLIDQQEFGRPLRGPEGQDRG
jgi:hypothetical protein